MIAIDTETGKKSEVYRRWAISLKETKKSKHKKRAGGRYRLLFSARGETDYETTNNSQKK